MLLRKMVINILSKQNSVYKMVVVLNMHIVCSLKMLIYHIVKIFVMYAGLIAN